MGALVLVVIGGLAPLSQAEKKGGNETVYVAAAYVTGDKNII